MAATQEHESLRERARRALLDNPDPEFTVPQVGPVPMHGPAPMSGTGLPSAEPSAMAEEVQLRLRAIDLVRDQEPRRACYADRVRDLSKTLMQLPGDSVHYRAVLEKLSEAHAEWMALEERLWAATYIIRSTQWLVDRLTDPTASAERGVSAHD
jgi:hypothetical protein